ncbi:hypothetical protein FQN54_007214 [Arachnomyces sp. PD_36]|nr:hypothetical protein FQN54_007214 [Arachnomyces sp. PD_36]
MDRTTEPSIDPSTEPSTAQPTTSPPSHPSPGRTNEYPAQLKPSTDPNPEASQPREASAGQLADTNTERAKAPTIINQALGNPIASWPPVANSTEPPTSQPNATTSNNPAGATPLGEQPSELVAVNGAPGGISSQNIPSESPADQPIEPSTNLPLARLNPELGHKRIQLGKYWTCIWCQYKKRTLLKGPDRSIKAGRSTSGCETCKVALCLKSECWEEFHRPTIPPTNESEPPSTLPVRRPKDLPPERSNRELEHRRVQLGPRLICLWCQYKLKHPQLQLEKPKRAGRTTSGCSTCRVPLCLKTKCWEKFHQPTDPLMTLPEKRLDAGISHQRIQFENMKACVWCQYKIKYIQPPSDGSKRPGRSTSGCSGCEVPLCTKNKCWEEFHKPTKPLMTLPAERLDSQLKHQRVQFGDRLMCVWCQYERKYPQPDQSVKRAGRTTSGCNTCQTPLCLKTKCWEEFHAS